MPNYNIQLDPLQIKGSSVVTVGGKRGVYIPEGLSLTISESGDQARLLLAAFEQRYHKNGQSHLLKAWIPKEQIALRGEDDLRRIPFIGNLVPWTK